MTFSDGETATMTSFALRAVRLGHAGAGRAATSGRPVRGDREAAGLLLVADAVDDAGRSARGVVEGTDTYGTTAFNAVEAALRLANGAAKAGVLAPAQAFDPAEFLDSLAVQGIRWDVTP